MSVVLTEPTTAIQTGADLLVKSLEAQGVEYVFGIPGAKIDKVFDTLLDSKIKTVVCRHEQNAAFIAGGIGRMTGKAGVALAQTASKATKKQHFMTTPRTAPTINSDQDEARSINGAGSPSWTAKISGSKVFTSP